ncbi:MAG: hypothetical protein EOO69_06865 [Moraxellaceae bacterium]|nr:MAG: hypothetical protein EOO69_06865 [Moraxellaceae bacterium]
MDDARSMPPDPISHADDPAIDLDDDSRDKGIEYVPVAVRVAPIELPDTQPIVIKQAEIEAHTAIDLTMQQPIQPRPTDTEPLPDQRIAISGKDVLQNTIIKLLTLARREVLLILPSMHTLFDEAQIGQRLLDFIKYSPKREVLILLNNLADQQATSHQLVKLAQRISSRIQLRQASSLLETPVMETDYLLVIDRTHILRIDDIDKYSGWFDVNFASRAQQYAASLVQQWPKAKEIKEFRQFTL